MMTEPQPQALVVDDDRGNRKLCRVLLELQGYQVVDASDGLVALEMLRHSCRFHLMVLDLRMPVMGGKAVLENLAQMPDHDHMHVIISTANPDMMAGLNKRYDYTAMKPLSVTDFAVLA